MCKYRIFEKNIKLILLMVFKENLLVSILSLTLRKWITSFYNTEMTLHAHILKIRPREFVSVGTIWQIGF